jgi:carboxyl-terminal processing protease
VRYGYRAVASPTTRSTRFPRLLRTVLLGVLPLAAAIACGGDGKSSTLTGPVTPGTPGTPTSPAAVIAYIDSAFNFTQTYFYYGDRINWPALRQRTFARAAGAQTFAQAHPALDTLARELNDPHSFFYLPSQTLGNREDPSGPLYTPISSVIAPKIGYLWLTSFGGINGVARADTLQQLIADADALAGGACGWIIDQRANVGGFWPVMLAGISPLVTPGLVGGFAERDARFSYYYYVGGGVAGLQEGTAGARFEYIATTRRYSLRRPNPPVALLQGQFTASAGEIVAMAFKETTRAVRTFGGPTTGVTTQPYTYRMRDTASLQITAAIMFDRLGHNYAGGSIPPDQGATGAGVAGSFTSAFRPGTRGEDVVESAISWLQSRPECQGTATAERDANDAASAARGTWQSAEPTPGARPATDWPKGKPTPWSAAALPGPRVIHR